MTFLKKITSNTNISADVVDGYLILSLPGAIDPVVWRMALDKIGTASFEVKKLKDNDKAKLVLKPKKGTAEIIASFNTQEEALDALVAASNAMQSDGQKQTVTANENSPKASGKTKNKKQNKTQKSNGNQWGIAFIGALAVIGLYYYLTTQIPQEINTAGTQGSTTTQTSSPTSTAGKPISADDYLSDF